MTEIAFTPKKPDWTPPKPVLFKLDSREPPAQYAAYTVQQLYDARDAGRREMEGRVKRLRSWLKVWHAERMTMKREALCMAERIRNQREEIKQLASTVDVLKIALINSKGELIDEKIKHLGALTGPVDPDLEALAAAALRGRPYDLSEAEQSALDRTLRKSAKFID